MIKDWLRAVTYPRFKYDPKSGFDPKKMKNRWGTGIPTMDFQWDSPPPLPNDSCPSSTWSKKGAGLS